MKKILVGLLVLGSLSAYVQSNENKIDVPVARYTDSTVSGQSAFNTEYFSAEEAFEFKDGSIKLINPFRVTAVGSAFCTWNQRKDVCEIFNFQNTESSKKRDSIYKGT